MTLEEQKEVLLRIAGVRAAWNRLSEAMPEAGTVGWMFRDHLDRLECFVFEHQKAPIASLQGWGAPMNLSATASACCAGDGLGDVQRIRPDFCLIFGERLMHGSPTS